MSGIKEATAIAGGQKRLAALVGVSQQSVSLWVTRGFAPVSRVVEIENHTGVPRERLLSPKVLDTVIRDRGAL